jgi:hypothetical protein
MSTINYRVFRSQFYIGPEAKTVNECWKSLPLQNGLHLSYDTDLTVQSVYAAGAQYVLLGTAVQSLAGQPPPIQQLQSLQNAFDLPQLYASWAGRWVLIANDEVHLDAGGLLGCYYKSGCNGTEVSTVPGLIAGCHQPDTFRLIKSGGAEFFPPPDSGFQQIQKLLPSQILNVKTGAVTFRNLQCNAPVLDYDETIAYLAELLATTLKNAFAANQQQKIVLALTGGFDSRTLMAALNFCGLPYQTITFHSPNIRPSDASIPKQLANRCGKEHRLIRRNRKNEENWKKFNQHTSGHSVETDREYMLYQQFNELEGGTDVLLRGGGFEVGRCAYYPWLPADNIDGAAISAIQKGNDAQGRSWNKWVQWVAQTPQITLDWRDRYYIEQRLSGWLACTEQALDMVNIPRLVPANSSLFYNVMLNLPQDIRKTKVQMTDLIRYLSPELLEVPINPPVKFYYKQYRRVLFKISKIKAAFNMA